MSILYIEKKHLATWLGKLFWEEQGEDIVLFPRHGLLYIRHIEAVLETSPQGFFP